MSPVPTLRLPSSRFLSLVLCVFALQLACILWLSDRRSHTGAKHRPEARVVLLTQDLLSSQIDELMRLRDGSLFALPHPESFSGAAWLSNAPLAYKAFDWTEPPRWLPIDFPSVQASLAPLASEVPAAATSISARRPEPDLAVPGMLNTELLPQRSRVRLLSGQDGLAAVQHADLPSWPHSELVSNSVVQLVLTADGKALSAALLAGSGYKPADEFALDYVRSIVLPVSPESASRSAAGPLRWATFSFDWHTGPPRPASK